MTESNRNNEKDLATVNTVGMRAWKRTVFQGNTAFPEPEALGSRRHYLNNVNA